MTEQTLVSLADLDASTAADTPTEVEFPKADGTGSGVFFLVLGDESKRVQEAHNKLLNERRKADATREALTGSDFVPIEGDIEFGHKLTAVKLVGWRGIKEAYSPEAALTLVRTNRRAAKFINDSAKRVAGF